MSERAGRDRNAGEAKGHVQGQSTENSIKENPQAFQLKGFLGGRSGGIWTRDLLLPKQTRYQAALHPESGANKGTRTLDLRFTKPLLYRLSYIGTSAFFIIPNSFFFV